MCIRDSRRRQHLPAFARGAGRVDHRHVAPVQPVKGAQGQGAGGLPLQGFQLFHGVDGLHHQPSPSKKDFTNFISPRARSTCPRPKNRPWGLFTRHRPPSGTPRSRARSSPPPFWNRVAWAGLTRTAGYRACLLYTSKAECRETYKISNVGMVIGSHVIAGKITRNAQVRVVRDGIIVADDKLASLRRFKDDVKEVADGYDCGITLEKFSDIKQGDILEAYEMEEYRD